MGIMSNGYAYDNMKPYDQRLGPSLISTVEARVRVEYTQMPRLILFQPPWHNASQLSSPVTSASFHAIIALCRFP